MNAHLFKRCNLEEIENTQPDEAFEYLPCQKKFKMKPEDEISLDSIFSAILSLVEPTEKQFKTCKWGVTAKEMHNEKQSSLFEEKLYISKLKDSNCKLSEEHKIFLESELIESGWYKLNIEESYDGYVVYSSSNMSKGKDKKICGHCLRGKYDDKFVLIVEKRSEFDYVDHARIEKNLEARLKEDFVHAIRETKINDESQKFKATINVKGRNNTFILDGGVMLLMRHLIINNFVGDYEYYSMNLFGKIIRCNLCISSQRSKIKIFYRTFPQAICVKNTQYYNDVPQEVSETFYSGNGKIILHYWHGYNYLLHSIHAPIKPEERILPKLELMWKMDNLLFQKYQREKKLNYENAVTYLNHHPEVSDLLHDYILSLLKYKPNSILEFTVKFFQNMKFNF